MAIRRGYFWFIIGLLVGGRFNDPGHAEKRALSNRVGTL